MDAVTVAWLSEPFMFVPKVSQKCSSRKYFPWENAALTESNPPGGNLSTAVSRGRNQMGVYKDPAFILGPLAAKIKIHSRSLSYFLCLFPTTKIISFFLSFCPIFESFNSFCHSKKSTAYVGTGFCLQQLISWSRWAHPFHLREAPGLWPHTSFTSMAQMRTDGLDLALKPVPSGQLLLPGWFLVTYTSSYPNT